MKGSASKEKKDRTLFNHIAEKYARKDSLPASAFPRRFLLKRLIEGLPEDLPARKTIIDIGCGIGAAARYLQGYYRRYIGIDQSEEMIARSRQFHQDPHVQFIASNVKSTSQSLAKTADLILSIGALHHMTDLPAVMRSLKHLAKPGAYLLAIEPHRGNPLIGLARHMRKYLDPAYSRNQVFFSETELKRLLHISGITFIKSDFIGFFSTPFAEVVVHPQLLFQPLSELTTRLDGWCHHRLPAWMKRLSFKMAVYGRFPG
jgi:SAM-dependent methyltransferase